MKTGVSIKITGMKEGVSSIKEGFFKTVREFAVDDQYTDGVDLWTIVTVKVGKQAGIDYPTLQVAKNTDTSVVPMGIIYAGSINKKQVEGEFYKKLPYTKDKLLLPLLPRVALIVKGIKAGKEVKHAFEYEDLYKPVFLGANGEIVMEKPTSTEYNTPIGYVADVDCIMLDLEHRTPKFETPVSRN